MKSFIMIPVIAMASTSAYAAKNCKAEAVVHFTKTGHQIESVELVSKDANEVIVKVRSNLHGGQAEDLVYLTTDCEIKKIVNQWSE